MRNIFLFASWLFCSYGSAQECFISIDSVLNNYSNESVFLLGEKHQEECNYRIQLEVFKELYKQGTYNLIIEYGSSVARLIQNYIDRENPSLDKEELFLKVFAKQDFYDWVDELYKLNKKQRNINIIGFDVQIQPCALLAEFETILDTTLLQTDTIAFLNCKEELDTIIKYIQQNNDKVESKFFGNEYQRLQDLITDYEVANTYWELRKEDISKAYNFREDYCYKILKNRLDSTQKYFGQIGHLHCIKNNNLSIGTLVNWESFTYKLENTKGLKIHSVALFNGNNMDKIDSLLAQPNTTGMNFDKIIIYNQNN